MSHSYVSEPSTTGKAIVRTDYGDLEVELWCRECPKACRNFLQLGLEGYYNGTKFHRIIKDFLIQGGDPTGTGEGGESIYGEPFPDEYHARLQFRYRGMIGVANAGQGTNTNGSQFFITLGAAPGLNKKATLFGKITGDTIFNLMRMADLEVDKEDRPVICPVIKSVEALNHPFTDMVPRTLRALAVKGHEAEPKVVAKPKIKANTNKRQIACADTEDSEEDSQPPAKIGKIKSAHDVVNSSTLSRETAYDKKQVSAAPKDPKVAANDRKKADELKARLARLGSGGAAEPAKARVSLSSEDSSDSESVSSGEAQARKKVDTVRSNRSAELAALERQVRAQRQQLKNPVEVVAEKKEPQKEWKLKVEAMRLKTQRKRKEREGKEKSKGGQIQKELDALRRNVKVASKEARAEADSPRKQGTKTKAEEGTLAAMLEAAEGGEDSEEDDDWLGGAGLKFAVDSTNAYKIDEARARKTIEVTGADGKGDKGFDAKDYERMKLRRDRERYHL